MWRLDDGAAYVERRKEGKSFLIKQAAKKRGEIRDYAIRENCASELRRKGEWRRGGGLQAMREGSDFEGGERAVCADKKVGKSPRTMTKRSPNNKQAIAYRIVS